MGHAHVADETKKKVVAEMARPGANADDVARAHGIHRSSVYHWLRQSKAKEVDVRHGFSFGEAPPKLPKPTPNEPVAAQEPDDLLELAIKAIRTAFARAETVAADEAVAEYRRSLKEWVDES